MPPTKRRKNQPQQDRLKKFCQIYRESKYLGPNNLVKDGAVGMSTPGGKIDVFIAGVGGQGTILAGRIISHVGLEKGLDVKLSETHGMAQRGGSVVTHVRLGEKVYSPLIPRGKADYLLAFEQLEALRWIDFLSETGTVITNTQRLNPLPVLTGMSGYPENVLEKIRSQARFTLAIDVLKETVAAQNTRVTNLVLIGALASFVNFEPFEWECVIAELVPPALLEINLQAFREGYRIGAACKAF